MKSTSQFELPNTYMRQFFRYLGSDPELLEGTNESPESLARIDGKNSFQDYCQFLVNAQSTLDEPAIGLVLGQMNLLANWHGPVTVAISQSTDIRDCLKILLRFVPIRNSAFRVVWYEDENFVGLEITFKQNAGAAHIPACETLMLSLTGIISTASENNIAPERIELDYERPEYVARYREALPNSTVLFSSENLRLLVSQKNADYITNTDQDPTLRSAAMQRCEELLRGISKAQTFSEQITQIFADNPGHLWTLYDIAMYLNTSERTLQRRLKEEKTTYKSLLDQWIKSETCRLLAEPSLSVESVGLMVGYSDVSNFRYACRRLFGMSPQAFREQLIT